MQLNCSSPVDLKNIIFKLPTAHAPPTIHIPADTNNTMSSYSEHLLGLTRDLIQKSSEWLVAIPFHSSHWIQDTKDIVSPTLFSSLRSSKVNLVLCIDKSKDGLTDCALLGNIHGYPSWAAFCLEGFIGGDDSTRVVDVLKVKARPRGTVLRFHEKTRAKFIFCIESVVDY